MAFTPKEVAELHVSVKTLLEIWMKVKLAFQKAFGKGEITKEQEAAFLQLKSDLSRTFRSVSQRLPKDLQFEGDTMMEMLKNAISMQHLQSLQITDKRHLFSQWHKIYVKMTRTYGALEVINQGYYPSLHRDLLKVRGSRGKSSKSNPVSRSAK